MGWTEVFPVFTEDQIDEFEEHATPEERAELEEYYGVERVLNPQPECRDIVSISLFWESIPMGAIPTREVLENARELGYARRCHSWEHHFQPMLEMMPELKRKFPHVAFRVYLAKDLEFLAADLAAAGNEVHLMKSPSIHFAPGALWKFLPFGEEGKRVTIIHVERLHELEADLLRTHHMSQAGVAAWRVPYASDLTPDRAISYLPFTGNQFGLQGGTLEIQKLLHAFTWQVRRNGINPMVILPGCGPLPLQQHRWPDAGFDEYFMSVAAYPRLAQQGMLTFVASFAKSQLLTLDVEYVTWGNPSSELLYYSGSGCCGVVVQEFDFTEDLSNHANEIPAALAEEPTIGFLFLMSGETHHREIWDEYLDSASERAQVFHAIKNEEADDRTILEATRSLLREGLENQHCTHYIFLSPSCVPVRPFAELARSLRLDPRTRMQVLPWEEVRKSNALKAQRLESLSEIRAELGHFHHSWICLSREDAALVMQKDWTPSFETMTDPHEAYIATTMAASGKSPLQTAINRAITWEDREVSWQDLQKVPPRIAAQISESGCFFAREFGSESDIGKWGLHVATHQI